MPRIVFTAIAKADIRRALRFTSRQHAEATPNHPAITATRCTPIRRTVARVAAEVGIVRIERAARGRSGARQKTSGSLGRIPPIARQNDEIDHLQGVAVVVVVGDDVGRSTATHFQSASSHAWLAASVMAATAKGALNARLEPCIGGSGA